MSFSFVQVPMLSCSSCIILPSCVFLPIQYPALFVLSMLTAVFGFVQPYESMYCNILESLLSLDVLVLLLMRNTEQISEELQVLPQSNITANQCAYTSGVTGFTWLLLPFYYFPLIVLAIVSSVVVIHYVR